MLIAAVEKMILSFFHFPEQMSLWRQEIPAMCPLQGMALILYVTQKFDVSFNLAEKTSGSRSFFKIKFKCIKIIQKKLKQFLGALPLLSSTFSSPLFSIN